MGMEWPLSTTLPLRPRPSAQPELPGESPPASLPTPVRPVSLLESVLRRRHCALCRSVDFEFRLAWRLALDCRSLAAFLFPRLVPRSPCRFLRSILRNYMDRFPPGASDFYQ